jgi:hypothetical protein
LTREQKKRARIIKRKQRKHGKASSSSVHFGADGPGETPGAAIRGGTFCGAERECADESHPGVRIEKELREFRSHEHVFRVRFVCDFVLRVRDGFERDAFAENFPKVLGGRVEIG